MKISGVKFNVKDQPEFIKELRNRVNNYFKDNNLSKHADANMKFKTVFMLLLYFLPFAFLLSGQFSSLGSIFFLFAIMGFGMVGIGLAVMHDANHDSYSKNKSTNQLLGFLINFLGSYHVTWRIQHNVLHHSFTNVHEHDEDIDNEVMRFSPNNKRKWIYRFQAFYAPFFYGLLSMHRLVSKDFQQLLRYNKMNLLITQGLTLKKALVQIITNKIFYLILTLVLPILILDIAWWQTVLGFLLMQFICGLILALIFQSAHVIEETGFYKTDESGSLENNWAIHQMNTTANFANKGLIFSWFIGGLNYQIEHHLFPNICHVHYKDISLIVKQTAKEFNVPYHQHKTFFGALKSHFSLLNSLGTGKYDLKPLVA